MKVALSLTMFAVCWFGVASKAQTEKPSPQTGASTPPPTVIVHATDELNNIRLLFRQGLNQQIIDRTTAILERADKPDPEIVYWRGYARRRQSLFDDALKDLEPLGNVTGWATLPSASQLTEEIKAIIALRPPHEMDIRDGDAVIFRVYYKNDDEFLQTVVDALPKGYKAASGLVEENLIEIPVFVFGEHDYAEFVRFFTIYRKTPPRFWWRVLSSEGAIIVSQTNQRKETFATNYSFMPLLLSHEMTHQFVRSVVGNESDFPNWLSEGAARCGEARYLPSLKAQNDSTIQKLLRQNAILPLNRLVSSTALQDSVDNQKDGAEQSDAYAQSFSMTRYLAFVLKGKTLRSFLDAMRTKGGFTLALQAEAGMTPEDFYQSWLQAIGGTND